MYEILLSYEGEEEKKDIEEKYVDLWSIPRRD